MNRDYQNAYDAEHLEASQSLRIGRDPSIDAALSAGRHAVIESRVVYCPISSAPLGEKEDLVQTCATREDAEQARRDYLDELGGDCGGELRVSVEPYEPERSKRAPADDWPPEDLPF